MKKPREDGTNKYRIHGTKELLYEALEIGQRGLSIKENEIILAVLVDNLSFTQIGDQQKLTPARIKQIYQFAFKRLIKKVREGKTRVSENPELHKRIFELEDIIKSQNLIIKAHDELTDLLNSLSNETRELLKTRVSETNLSPRAKNVCSLNDIITVNDLVRLSPKDILNQRNVGRTTFKEIDLFLSTNDLNWNMFRK